MQWDKLKTFYYAAKFASFTKAGEHLNVSQSSISRQVIELEARLGHKLFTRLPRGLHLTRQGEILFQSTEKMFMLAELACSQIESEQTEPQGSLSINANIGLVETWLYQVIPSFLHHYPKINLSISSKNGDLDKEPLEAHVHLKPYMEDRPDLIQTFLMRWNRRLYASEDYLQQYGTPQTVEDLNHHRLIGFGPKNIPLFNYFNWHLKLSNKGKKSQKSYLDSNSLRTIFHLGQSGIGIISFSQECPLLEDSDLIEVLPEVVGPSLDIYFSYPAELKGIKKIDILEQYLKNHVNNYHHKFI